MPFLYGFHAGCAALLNADRIIEDVWCTAKTAQRLKEGGIVDRAPFLHKHPLRIVERKALDAKVPEEAGHQGLVLKVQPLLTDPLDLLQTPTASGIDRVVLLDNVTDPQNVGGILRLCRVFGARALVMTTAHAPQETGAMAKVASGALEVVPRCLVPNLATALRSLQQWGFWCVGLAEGAPQSLRELNLRGRIAIVMGSEGKGLRRMTRDLCDFHAVIPTAPSFSTLNVTSATAISLYEVFAQAGESEGVEGF